MTIFFISLNHLHFLERKKIILAAPLLRQPLPHCSFFIKKPFRNTNLLKNAFLGLLGIKYRQQFQLCRMSILQSKYVIRYYFNFIYIYVCVYIPHGNIFLTVSIQLFIRVDVLRNNMILKTTVHSKRCVFINRTLQFICNIRNRIRIISIFFPP